jgi:hypothetical protein
VTTAFTRSRPHALINPPPPARPHAVTGACSRGLPTHSPPPPAPLFPQVWLPVSDAQRRGGGRGRRDDGGSGTDDEGASGSSIDSAGPLVWEEGPGASEPDDSGDDGSPVMFQHAANDGGDDSEADGVAADSAVRGGLIVAAEVALALAGGIAALQAGGKGPSATTSATKWAQPPWATDAAPPTDGAAAANGPAAAGASVDDSSQESPDTASDDSGVPDNLGVAAVVRPARARDDGSASGSSRSMWHDEEGTDDNSAEFGWDDDDDDEGEGDWDDGMMLIGGEGGSSDWGEHLPMYGIDSGDEGEAGDGLWDTIEGLLGTFVHMPGGVPAVPASIDDMVAAAIAAEAQADGEGEGEGVDDEGSSVTSHGSGTTAATTTATTTSGGGGSGTDGADTDGSGGPSVAHANGSSDADGSNGRSAADGGVLDESGVDADVHVGGGEDSGDNGV